MNKILQEIDGNVKCSICIECRNREYFGVMENQIFHIFTSNRISSINAYWFKDHDNIMINFSDSSEYLPMINLGYQEEFAHMHQIIVKENDVPEDNFTININCRRRKDFKKIGILLHNQLRGLDDYFNNTILLNYDNFNNGILLSFRPQTGYFPIISLLYNKRR